MLSFLISKTCAKYTSLCLSSVLKKKPLVNSHSKCGPRAGSSSTTWKLVRNDANSQAPLQTH